jgi:hypothetical protein
MISLYVRQKERIGHSGGGIGPHQPETPSFVPVLSTICKLQRMKGLSGKTSKMAHFRANNNCEFRLMGE